MNVYNVVIVNVNKSFGQRKVDSVPNPKVQRFVSIQQEKVVYSIFDRINAHCSRQSLFRIIEYTLRAPSDSFKI